MLSISWRSILRVIAGASLIVAIICIFNPKYESWIPVVAAIVTFASSFAVSDTPISSLTSEKTKSTREERHRQDLLKRVKNGWVKGVLEQSLHGEVLIELGLEERRDAVLTRQGIELKHPASPTACCHRVRKLWMSSMSWGRHCLSWVSPGLVRLPCCWN